MAYVAQTRPVVKEAAAVARFHHIDRSWSRLARSLAGTGRKRGFSAAAVAQASSHTITGNRSGWREAQ
jgi:hypothetical protein